MMTKITKLFIAGYRKMQVINLVSIGFTDMLVIGNVIISSEAPLILSVAGV